MADEEPETGEETEQEEISEARRVFGAPGRVLDYLIVPSSNIRWE